MKRNMHADTVDKRVAANQIMKRPCNRYNILLPTNS